MPERLSIVDEIATLRTDIVLYKNEYGNIQVPSIPHKDRKYGGHLMASPAKEVHHVNELRKFPGAFLGYHILCTLAEEAMLNVIPSLQGGKGIINLFEAGNWQVHPEREPSGLKDASFKSVHAHLYGRSTLEPATNDHERQLHWEWGEAPYFPAFKDTPFSPQRAVKNWIVPAQYNDDEIKSLKEYIEDAASRIKKLSQKWVAPLLRTRRRYQINAQANWSSPR